ncbi:MAG TPA: NAD-dependent epimerase/dehydratase family protein [Candidatus Angelobacter sp.]
MNILAIGGTGFIGPFTIRQLQQAGHNVTVFHRGTAAPPAGVKQIVGDRNRLSDYRPVLAPDKFDVVIDFIVSSERQARQLMETLRGTTRRVVVLSSMDTYRGWGVFYGLEPGGLEPLPVNEESAVRTRPDPPEVVKKLQQIVSWADDEYDKVPAERVVLSDPELPGTILRLPMVYGPGDYVHRFHPFLKRMDDGRPFILFAEDVAAVRTPRGYVEDVAMGICAAATAEQASGRVYNICETQAWSELEWAKKIAAAAGWHGEFILLPRDKTPAHLVWPFNTAQHLVVSSERIRQELGYRDVTPREEAFEDTIRWERAHPPEGVGIPLNYPAEDAAINDLKASA